MYFELNVGPQIPLYLYVIPSGEILCDDLFPERLLVLTSQSCHLLRSPLNLKGKSFNFPSILKAERRSQFFCLLGSLGLWSGVDLLGQLAIYKNAHLPFQSSVCWATLPLGWNLFSGDKGSVS